jgi:hypothetical protein
MEFAFALAAVFGARHFIEQLPRSVKTAFVFLLLAFAAEQIVSTRRFSKDVLRSANPSHSIEFRASTWAAQNLHGTRVMMPGSIGQWTNAFTDLQQFTGSSWSIAYNPVQQRAVEVIYAGSGNAEADVSISLAWLKAYGVGAVCVSGRESPEFWKPFQNPTRFQGVLPILWQAQDTTIYRIPQRSTSLAHVVPESAIVRHVPVDSTDMTELERYVAALDDPKLPDAEFEWKTSNRVHIRADVRQGQLLSVQISYHPGWRARMRDRPLEVGRDQLGLMWIRTESAGPSDIELEYSGSWELRISHWVSMVSIALLFIILPLRREYGERFRR